MKKSRNEMILGKRRIYSLDPAETGINNNVLVVGASGTGKTRGIVIPNLLQAVGSYIVLDPKGNLYGKYREYLEGKGYIVKKLDFTDPCSSEKYNPLSYIHGTQDITKIAHMLMSNGRDAVYPDPFWNESSQMLLQAAIAYLREACIEEDRNLERVIRLLDYFSGCSLAGNYTLLDKIMKVREEDDKDSYAVKMFNMVRMAPYQTIHCILTYLFSRIGIYGNPDISNMIMSDSIDIPSIGKIKTVLYVVVSDTDRSMDAVANLFFTQAINELCSFADKECRDSCLPMPVRIIMDDFATNCKIEDFPRMISSIRSRGISAMIMIQSLSQLSEMYGKDGKTIMGNCDTHVYLGSNDIETAESIALRCGLPLKDILNMPAGTNWIFRRGEKPVYGVNMDL